MILYDKDTKFLGASADVLSVLGYEDIKAFTAYNNDVADLFVNKQGYVYKFDNFSWISYVLNGSLPNKNVIIKTRSGNEIEAAISITELFLYGKDDKCYIVSLNNIHQIPSNMIKEDGLYNKQPIFKIDNNKEKQPIFTEQQTNANIVTMPDDTDNKISFTFNEEDLKPIVPTTYETVLPNTENLKSAADVDIVHQIQPNMQQNDAVSNTVEIKIDVQEISDLLGIDKTDIIKYLKEYVSYLDTNLSHLQDIYKNGDILQAKRIIVNMIGIGSNLRSKELVQILQKLLSVGSNMNSTLILQELEAVISAFEQSVSKL